MINIQGLSKAMVLATLYNASRPQGMGFLHYDAKPMTEEEAQAELDQCQPGRLYFDYLKGRVMKVNLTEDEFDEWGFDRDNGPGSAQAAIDSLRALGTSDNQVTASIHKGGVLAAAEIARNDMATPSTLEQGDGFAKLTMTMAGVSEHVAPAVDKALEAIKED